MIGRDVLVIYEELLGDVLLQRTKWVGFDEFCADNWYPEHKHVYNARAIYAPTAEEFRKLLIAEKLSTPTIEKLVDEWIRMREEDAAKNQA